jgi:hypothetical protein
MHKFWHCGGIKGGATMPVFAHKLYVLLFLLSLSACVHARVAQPIQMKQTADSSMTCEEIATEYKTNTEVAAAKIAKNSGDDTRELWLGILVWPGLFDLQNADGTEGNAILDRNLYLKETATGKKCTGLDAWPKQPERYT